MGKGRARHCIGKGGEKVGVPGITSVWEGSGSKKKKLRWAEPCGGEKLWQSILQVKQKKGNF